MESETSLIIDATRKASRFLQRDYFELESLQSSERSLESFCQKACGKALQILHENLSKYFRTIIFDNTEASRLNFTGKALLVETLDGFKNLERSLPFFAIMVTLISKNDDEIITEKAVMNFPALGEIYYAEKGKGTWLERHSSNMAGASRVRISGTIDLQKAVISCDLEHLSIAQKISTNFRFYESYTYALSLLISGKIDALLTAPRSLSNKAIELFINESAGSFYMKNDLLLASNFKLHEKIKAIL